MKTPERKKLDAALKEFRRAANGVYKAAEVYARAEVRTVSKRYPTRRIDWLSGMGTCALYIERHGNHTNKDRYMIAENFADHVGGRELSTPEFMKELAQVEADTGLNGIADALFSFKNGKRLPD